MNISRRLLPVLFALVLVTILVLAGCGGRGALNDVPPPPTATPEIVVGKPFSSLTQSLDGKSLGRNEAWEIKVRWSDGVERPMSTASISINGMTQNLPWLISARTVALGEPPWVTEVQDGRYKWKLKGRVTFINAP